MLEPTCVWRISAEIISALQERFGDPLDSYVNGSQVWLLDNGPNEITLQWRLHPVAGYVRPVGMETFDVFTTTAFAIANGDAPPTPLHQLWDGLEAWPAYGDAVEDRTLEQAVKSALAIAPDVCGRVDHQTIGDTWEQKRRNVSIIELLFEQLRISQ